MNIQNSLIKNIGVHVSIYMGTLVSFSELLNETEMHKKKEPVS